MGQEILIVEDDVVSTELIKRVLEKANYKVVSAPNGQEALALVKQRNPALIISDVVMPVMDGYAFYKELKKDPATSRIPVLIQTSRGKMEDSFRVLGIDDFIVKPLDTDALLFKVEGFLKKPAEQPPQTAKKTKNILVIGSVAAAVQTIAAQLKKEDRVMETTTLGSEVIPKGLQLKPNVILIEAAMTPTPPEEIVQALRRNAQFNAAKILVYSNVSSKSGDKFGHLNLSKINDSSHKCLEAGANEYIGPPGEPLFSQMIEKYLA